MKEIIDIVHKSIYPFFDVCEDGREEPLSDKDKLLLSVNKAICNNLKALEKEPCEDTISRQAVLDMQYIIDDSATLSSRDVVNVDDIEDLPPVTPQQKIGHWIYNEKYSTQRDATYECSCCRRSVFTSQGSGNAVYEVYPYCHCGARMIDGLLRN